MICKLYNIFHVVVKKVIFYRGWGWGTVLADQTLKYFWKISVIVHFFSRLLQSQFESALINYFAKNVFKGPLPLQGVTVLNL